MAYESFQLTDSAYIPQYVGAPLEAIEKTADQLQERHYANVAAMRNLELMGLQQKANIASQADKDYIDSQLSGVQEALGELAKNGAENATARVSALATQFLGDEGLLNIKKSADALQRRQAMFEQLGGKGIENKKLYEDYIKNGSRDPETGKWKPFVNTAQAQLDYMRRQDEVLAPLEADTTQSDLLPDLNLTMKRILGDKAPANFESLSAALKTTIVNALSAKKVQDYIDKKGGWEVYKQSSEYDQQKNVLGLSDEEIYEQLKSRGAAKVFSKVQKDWEKNYGIEMLGKEEQPVNGVGSYETLPGSAIKVESAVGDIDQFELRDRTETSWSSSSDFYGGSGPGPVVSGSAKGYKGVSKGLPEKRWQAYREYAKMGAEVFGGTNTDFSNINEKSDPAVLKQAHEYAKKYNDLVTKRQEFRTNDTSFTKREGEEGRSNAEDINKDVQNNIKSRAIYDVATGKMIPVTSSDGTAWSDKFQEIIKNPKNINVIGSLDPQHTLAKEINNPEFADAYIAEVTDPDGPSKTRQVYITRAADSKKNPYSRYNKLVNKMYSEIVAEPGKEKTIDLGGLQVTAKQLIGNQLKTELGEGSDLYNAALNMEQPVLVKIPGFDSWKLMDGSKEVANFITNPANAKSIKWNK